MTSCNIDVHVIASNLLCTDTVDPYLRHRRAGHLLLWVVVQLSRPEPHGSESDLGLVPGGRVKLVKSASVEVCQSHPTSR